ncbi:MAG: hypothetical protein PHU46_16575 [Rhodocyclaceae bacterium]|nr:hypothetical protein [Rhodocyclaceae bacterium]
MRYLAAICAVVIGMFPGLSRANDLLGVVGQVVQGIVTANSTPGNRPANPAAYPGNVAPQAVPATMAVPAQGDGEQKTQLLIPADHRTRDAIDAALPTVKQVVAIHRCVRVPDGLLRLNFLAVPGANLIANLAPRWAYPDSDLFMKYHDISKCVNARAIDSWAMPALNALRFRVVYFAEDSGETVNFTYLMMKVDDGSWKLQSINRS